MDQKIVDCRLSSLRITDVKTYYLEWPLSQPARSLDGVTYTKKWPGLTLVKIFTDEGLVGIGGQHTTWTGWKNYLEDQVKSFVLKEIIEPFYVEKFSSHFCSKSPGADVAPGPNCVEIALWDLIGKAASQPIYKLLGARKDKVKAYLSLFPRYPPWTAEEAANFTKEHHFLAVKVHRVTGDIEKDLSFISSLRAALGYGTEIMLDAEQAWMPSSIYDFGRALKMAKGLERYDVAWFEDPLSWDRHPELVAKLAAAVDIPIAGGGRLYGAHKFKPLMVNDVLDIVQPDPQYSGGILEVKKIAMLADLYGKVCVPHGGMQDSTGLCLAANLQVTGASDIPYLEYDLYPPAYDEKVRDRILKEPIVMRKDGYVYIPDKPGLGVELDEEAVAKYIVL